MICPNCHASNKEGAKFCNECGRPFHDLMERPSVRNNLQDSFHAPADATAQIKAAPYSDAAHRVSSASSRQGYEPDLSGFDECLADATYVPPAAFRMGDTVRMPAITEEALGPRRHYRATAVKDKGIQKLKRKLEDRRLRKAQEALALKEQARLRELEAQMAKLQPNDEREGQQEDLEAKREETQASPEVSVPADRSGEVAPAPRSRKRDRSKKAIKPSVASVKEEAAPKAPEALVSDASPVESAAEDSMPAKAPLIETIPPLAKEEEKPSLPVEKADAPSRADAPAGAVAPAKVDEPSNDPEKTADAPEKSADAPAESEKTASQAKAASPFALPAFLRKKASQQEPRGRHAHRPDTSSDAPESAPLAVEDAAHEDATGDSWVKDESAPVRPALYAGENSSEDDELQDESRRSKRSLLVALIMVLVAIFVAAAVTNLMELWGGKTVPDVMGMTQADAAFLLEEKGFTVCLEEAKSDEVEGVVLKMEPDKGSRLSAGSEVTIYISKARAVPELEGLSLSEAQELLDREGFENIVVEEQRSSKDAGLVLGVNLEPGTKAKADDEIVLTVAKPFTVPDISGKSRSEATQILNDAGYLVDFVSQTDDSVAEGTVLGIEPEAGAELAEGSTVVMKISRTRASELTDLSNSYLASTGSLSYGGISYPIISVEEVYYSGQNLVSFRATVSDTLGGYAELAGYLDWSGGGPSVVIG